MAWTTVEGTVSRLNRTGNGFGVKEEREVQGKTRTTYWSVFPPRDDARTVSEGDRVKVSGGLGTEVSKRDARFVDHTLNSARVEVLGGSGSRPVPLAADDETPF